MTDYKGMSYYDIPEEWILWWKNNNFTEGDNYPESLIEAYKEVFGAEPPKINRGSEIPEILADAAEDKYLGDNLEDVISALDGEEFEEFYGAY